MDAEYENLLRNGFDRYINAIDSGGWMPDAPYLTYDFDFLKNRKWFSLGETMVGCDLRELTNLINGWKQLLVRWQVWNSVISEFEADSAYELRVEFLNSIAHECLLKPSAIRDTLTSVATNALHQIRLSTEPGYRDFLEGDPVPPKMTKRHLSRGRKEKRLKRISSVWDESSEFLERLMRIDTVDYVRTTFDYRNLHSHTIGPRLSVGYTRTVTRSVGLWTNVEVQSNGTFLEVEDPNRASVSYGFGGTPPLELEKARVANLGQFYEARHAYISYRALLEHVVAGIEVSERAT